MALRCLEKVMDCTLCSRRTRSVVAYSCRLIKEHMEVDMLESITRTSDNLADPMTHERQFHLLKE